VPLEPEDFAAADPKQTSTVEVMEFADESEIDVRYLETPYYLEPEEGAGKAYGLLREALKQTGLVAVARFVLREREHLAVIKPVGGVLVLNQMRFPSDVKSPAGLKLPVEKPAAEELKLAEALIRQQTRGFAAVDFHDTFTEKLETRIQAKLKHLPAPKPKEEAAAKPPADLIAALKASLAGTEAR